MNTAVEQVFMGYPPEYRQPLLQLRELIYSVAKGVPQAGDIEESLKWGQPSYATAKTKSGSPIRLGRFGENKIALFFHCQTTLVESFRTLFRGELEFSKNRAIVLNPEEELPKETVALCIQMALTYHVTKAH